MRGTIQDFGKGRGVVEIGDTVEPGIRTKRSEGFSVRVAQGSDVELAHPAGTGIQIGEEVNHIVGEAFGVFDGDFLFLACCGEDSGRFLVGQRFFIHEFEGMVGELTTVGGEIVVPVGEGLFEGFQRVELFAGSLFEASRPGIPCLDVLECSCLVRAEGRQDFGGFPLTS